MERYLGLGENVFSYTPLRNTYLDYSYRDNLREIRSVNQALSKPSFEINMEERRAIVGVFWKMAFEKIECNETLEYISIHEGEFCLSGNEGRSDDNLHIDCPVGVKVWINYLHELDHLKRLKISYCSFSDHAWEVFCEEIGSFKRKLEIEFCNCTILTVQQALSKPLMAINGEGRLRSAECYWKIAFERMEQGKYQKCMNMQAGRFCLNGYHSNSNQVLDINCPMGVKALIHHLKPLEHLTSMQLVCCSFSDETWEVFCEGIASFKKLTELEFAKCNISDTQWKHFSRASQYFERSIPRFHVLSGKGFSNAHLESLFPYFSGKNAPETLRFQQCAITDETFQFLCELLTNCHAVTGLYLEHNRITDKGLIAIESLIRENPMLRSLSLRGNGITDEGMKILSKIFSREEYYPFNLGLEENRGITDEGAIALLEGGLALKLLGLNGNQNIRQLRLLNIVFRAKRIQTLGLGCTGINDTAIEEYLQSKKVVPHPDHVLYLSFLNAQVNQQVHTTKPRLEELERFFSHHQVCVLYDDSTPFEGLFNPEYHQLRKQIIKCPEITQELLDDVHCIRAEEYAEELFELILKKQFRVVSISDDGDCFFRAVAKQMDVNHPLQLRRSVADYIRQNAELYQFYIIDEEEEPKGNEKMEVEDPIEASPLDRLMKHCHELERSGTWAEQVDLCALVQMWEEQGTPRQIHIYDRNYPCKVENGKLVTHPELAIGGPSDKPPITLYRLNDNHYNALLPQVDEISQSKETQGDKIN